MMTQYQDPDQTGVRSCPSGHAARHMVDMRSAAAGGGHFIECACIHTSRYAVFERALAEWNTLLDSSNSPCKRSTGSAGGTYKSPGGTSAQLESLTLSALTGFGGICTRVAGTPLAPAMQWNLTRVPLAALARRIVHILV